MYDPTVLTIYKLFSTITIFVFHYLDIAILSAIIYKLINDYGTKIFNKKNISWLESFNYSFSELLYPNDLLKIKIENIYFKIISYIKFIYFIIFVLLILISIITKKRKYISKLNRIPTITLMFFLPLINIIGNKYIK